MFSRTVTFRKRFALGLVVVCLALALTFTISPAARAAALALAHDIGGLVFNEADHPGEAALPAGAMGGYDLVTSKSPGEAGITPLPEEIVSLEVARQRLGYTFGLPTWAPAGFTQGEEIRWVIPDGKLFSAPSVLLRWTDAGQGVIDMSVTYPAPANLQHVVGQGSVETVQVNGQPASLQHGLWSLDSGQWVDTGLLVLRWIKDGAVYQLSADAATVQAEALITMAESIP